MPQSSLVDPTSTRSCSLALTAPGPHPPSPKRRRATLTSGSAPFHHATPLQSCKNRRRRQWKPSPPSEFPLLIQSNLSRPLMFPLPRTTSISGSMRQSRPQLFFGNAAHNCGIVSVRIRFASVQPLLPLPVASHPYVLVRMFPEDPPLGWTFCKPRGPQCATS